jgi:hypothetical protein
MIDETNMRRKNQRWPNLFIVGAARSGTSSLHEYLNRVEGIHMCSVKEPNFFIEEVGPNYRDLLALVNEEEKYLSLFQPREDDSVMGESSVSYLYDSNAANKIHEKIPDAKILIILRDPIDRAYSHFLYDLRHGVHSTFDFLQALRDDYNREKKGIGYTQLYVEYGMYSNQVQRYFDVFGQNRVKVIIYEDEFKTNTRKTIQDIISFLGLRSNVPNDDVIQRVFNTSMESSTGSFLVPRYGLVRTMTLLARDIRENSPFLKRLTYPITNSISKNFLLRNQERPPLSAEAVRFMLNIYREDVQDLCKILETVPGWAAKYQV